MNSTPDREMFQALAGAGAEDGVARGLGVRLKSQPAPAVVKALAALWLHGAVAAPERARRIYDATAEGYIGEPIASEPPSDNFSQPPEPIPMAFWMALWDLLDAPRQRGGSLNLVSTSCSMSGLISTRVQERAAMSAMAFPGVAGAFAQGYPRPFTRAALARCSKRSLGGLFLEGVVASGSDLAVADREAPPLVGLPPPLPYLHTRLQQCHGLWRIVGGYEATRLHDSALLAFQLAQCGYPPAAMHLAIIFTLIVFERPEGAAIMMRTILDAWAHGRRTPPLLGVNWPGIWDRQVEQVRSKLKVTSFVSAYPADLFEQVVQAA